MQNLAIRSDQILDINVETRSSTYKGIPHKIQGMVWGFFLLIFTLKNLNIKCKAAKI